MEKKGLPFPFLPDPHTIFVDSSIDTHLAMVVSPHDTISDVKAKIRDEHALCFQDIGEISIRAIKVKRRGFFYYLADSMRVWNAFHGFKGTWFVCIDAVPMSPMKSPEVVANEVTHEHMKHHFNDGVAISPCELEKKLGPDGQGSHNSIVMSRDHECRPEMLIDQEKDGGRKGECQNLGGDETCNGMPASCTHKTISGKRSKASLQDNLLTSQSQHYLVEKKRGKKVKNGLHEEHLEDRRGSKFSRSESIDDHLEDGKSKKEILVVSSEGLPSKLPPENTIPLQNPSVEKHKKRKKKSSKSHEEVHLAKPLEIIVPRSPQVTVDPCNSWKQADASIFLEKYPIEPNINLSLPNDCRDMRMAHDTASSFEVTNQKEKDGHSIETCMVVISPVNEEPIEGQVLPVNPEDHRERHVNLGQETIDDVRLKESEEIRISLQVPSELPSKSYCSIDKLMSRSSQVLEPKDANDQQSREFDAATCVTELNLREDEIAPVDEKAGISALAEKFSYEEQALSGDKHQGLDKETDAAANLKGANKGGSLTQVDSKVLHKSRRSKKKLKTGSSRAFESTVINGDQAHFSSDSAQVSLNDVHNESSAAKIIKHADQKANGGHCVVTTIKFSSSSKEVTNQDQVSHLNSGNPPISMPHNLSKVSNSHVEQAPENRITSQPAIEVQAMPCRSRKNLKSEPCKLGSPEVSDVVLVKSNEEVTGSNGGRGSDPSKLANRSNQKVEQHCIDTKLTVSLSDEDSSKLAKMPQANLLDSSSCKQQDLWEQSNAKVIIKEGDATHILSHGALAGSTNYKCDRKKSKKEVVKARVSSEMSEHVELRGHGDASIYFSAYFISKESTADSLTDLVQSVSHKRHGVESPPQEGDISHHSAVGAAHDNATKESKTGNAEKAKSTDQISKQNSLSRTESNPSLHEVNEYQKLMKKLQDYGPQIHCKLPKSGGMESKHGKITEDGKEETLSLPLDGGIGNMVSNDENVLFKNFNPATRSNPVVNVAGSNNFYVSPSEGMTNQVASSDSTEDTPYHLRRFRVVRKIPIRRSKSITHKSNGEKPSLASSGRI